MRKELSNQLAMLYSMIETRKKKARSKCNRETLKDTHKLSVLSTFLSITSKLICDFQHVYLYSILYSTMQYNMILKPKNNVQPKSVLITVSKYRYYFFKSSSIHLFFYVWLYTVFLLNSSELYNSSRKSFISDYVIAKSQKSAKSATPKKPLT